VVEETDKIKEHIESERERLSDNLDEIEYRFKDATDLKAQFERNTGWILGAAVAGGFLLSVALGRSSRLASNDFEREEATPGHSRFVSPHLNRLSDTVDNIVAGLVGVFSDKLQSFVADAVPGFREQYDTMNTKGSAPGDVTRSSFGR